MAKTPVFNRRFKNKVRSAKVGTLVRKSGTAGEIGIEVEVEGNKFPKDNPSSYEYIPAEWKYHKDGSLRGQDNAEYVLKKPILFSEVPQSISNLWHMFAKYGSVLDESNRTSVHVHLNVQNFHLNRLCSFMALYFSVEEILTEWCGEHRVGNLFCLRAKDAPALITSLKDFFVTQGKSALPDGLHYAGLNGNSISKFGSVEIRSLRGVTDPKHILDWVSVLERLYKMSAEYPDPRTICDNFSGIGPIGYISNILGPQYEPIKKAINYTDQDMISAGYTGIRLAQDLCYCIDWSMYEPLELKKDPFDRSEEEVADSLATLMNQQSDGSMGMTPHTINPFLIYNADPINQLMDLYSQSPQTNPEYDILVDDSEEEDF